MTQPGSVGNIVPPGDDDVYRRLRDLQRQIDELRGARSLEAATIGAGGVTITQDGSIRVIDQASGRDVFYVGKANTIDGARQMVTEWWRDDGTPALVLGDLGTVPGHAHRQALQWFDRSGNVVLADDTDSGVGVARPFVPLGQMVDITPPVTTNSTTYTALQWADCFQQHPRVTASILANVPAGVAGTFRLTINGVQIGAAVSVPAGSFGQFTISEAAWPAGTYVFGQRAVVQLEGRVSGGAGNVGARCLGLWGVAS